MKKQRYKRYMMVVDSDLRAFLTGVEKQLNEGWRCNGSHQHSLQVVGPSGAPGILLADGKQASAPGQVRIFERWSQGMVKEEDVALVAKKVEEGTPSD